jgi:hypothetical protein
VTALLKKAFDRISEELPDDEQDQIAQFLVRLIEDDDAKWDAVLAKSPDKLRELADRAFETYLAGRTSKLDIEKL